MRKSITPYTLVLDMDETLVNTADSITELGNVHATLADRVYMISFPEVNGNTIIPQTVWGVKRPYLNPFLEFCFKYFAKVILWSAGEYDYVHKVAEDIFRNLPKPDYILTRNDCIDTKDGCIKPLSTLYKMDPMIKPHHTLFIDDEPLSYLYDPNNAIDIPKYIYPNEDDRALLVIAEWLSKVKQVSPRQVDFRKLIKPF
jgi:TFIIF-interacting CTD phosphatase-like protein